MKSFIFSICALTVLVILIIINSFYVSNVADNLINKVENLSYDSINEIEELKTLWDKKSFLISLSSSDKEIDRIDEAISILEKKSENQIQADFEETKVYLIKYIELIKEHEKITINNLL